MTTLILAIKSAILGIVEGLTEFLPVSSTGHLVIFQNLLKFEGTTPNYVEMYTYVIQLGAILAVLILYWSKIKETLVNFFPKKVGFEKSGFRFWFMIGLACIPGAIAGITIDDIVEKYLFNPLSIAITLFLGGIWMIYAEKRFRDTRSSLDSSGISNLIITPRQAIIIGLFQCLAVIPGMSRSASTIIGGWVAGLSTVQAAEFSFFLAIPVMVGMSFLKIVKIGGLSLITGAELLALIVGFLVSFIVALLVINSFISYLKKKPMKNFAIYRMVFAVIVVLAGFLKLI